MYIFTQILNQKYSNISIFVISKILKTFDYENLFSNEEGMNISTFGTENREKIILDTEDKKRSYLYYPMQP